MHVIAASGQVQIHNFFKRPCLLQQNFSAIGHGSVCVELFTTAF